MDVILSLLTLPVLDWLASRFGPTVLGLRVESAVCFGFFGPRAHGLTVDRGYTSAMSAYTCIARG